MLVNLARETLRGWLSASLWFAVILAVLVLACAGGYGLLGIDGGAAWLWTVFPELSVRPSLDEWLQTTASGGALPLAVMLASSYVGVSLAAGRRASRLLAFMAAGPASRGMLVRGHLLALVACVAVATAGAWLALAATGAVNMLFRSVQVGGALALLGVCFSTFGFSLGNAFGRLGPALAAVWAVGLAAFGIERAGALLAPSSVLPWLSPFEFYRAAAGLPASAAPWTGWLALFALLLALFALASLTFGRRDLAS